MRGDMPVSFAEYLGAKFDLDQRSLNREVGEALRQALNRLPKVECLDVGAGIGATARRLLQHGLATPLSLMTAALLSLPRRSSVLQRSVGVHASLSSRRASTAVLVVTRRQPAALDAITE